MYHHQSHFLRNIRKIIGGEKTMKCKLSRHFALLLLYTNFEEKKKICKSYSYFLIISRQWSDFERAVFVLEILPNGIAEPHDDNMGFHDDGILIQENPF